MNASNGEGTKCSLPPNNAANRRHNIACSLSQSQGRFFSNIPVKAKGPVKARSSITLTGRNEQYQGFQKGWSNLSNLSK